MMRFAMPRKAPPGLWRRVPPAIFPPILGAMGLAMAWQQAAALFALPPAIADLGAGVMAAVAAFALVAYVAKLARRPTVLADEMAILPGRAGVAAAVLCVYVLGGLIAPFSLGLGRGLLIAGLGLHIAVLTVLLGVYRNGPPERRQVTPVWHLNWVGFIVAARIALPLGWPGLSGVILWPALAAALAIWAISAVQFLRAVPPAPLRPMLAIHAAPAALIGSVALALGGPGWLVTASAFVALGLLMVLAVSARWLLQAGFSPLWGAMTFPLATTTGLWLALAAVSGGAFDRAIAAALLITATLTIPPILFLVLRDWARGRLAVKTNAAIA